MLSDTQNIFLACHDETSHESLEIGEVKLGYYISPNLAGLKNEDALIIKNKDGNIIAGVADGAGGYPSGEIASKIVLEESCKDLSESVLKRIDLANEAVRKETSGGKSTLALAKITDSEVRFTTVGDSEVLLWNSNGNLIYKSIPHSIVGHKVEAGVISQDESLEDPERNIVTFLLGDRHFSIQSSSQIFYKKGYACLIGTDGLFDNMTHTEIEELTKGRSFNNAFDALVESCQNRSDGNWFKDDDIAFIYISW